MAEIKHTLQSSNSLIERARDRQRLPSQVYGLPWGYNKLDNLTHGIQQGEMTLLIARAGVGKSAFAGKTILSVCKYLRNNNIDKVVRLISLEMTLEAWLQRIACLEAVVSAERIDTGYASQEELDRYEDSLEGLKRMPLECLDELSSLEQLDTFIRYNSKFPEAKKSNCAFWVMDHIGLMPGSGVESVNSSLAAASALFRILSRDVAPSLILSQMNRNSESRDNKRPNLGDVYGSDRMTQDARKVFGLYRDDYYQALDDLEMKRAHPSELHVLKSNNGKQGKIDMWFHGPSLDWRDMDEVE